MPRRWIIGCAAAAAAACTIAGCSSGGDGTSRPTGSAAPVEPARSAFCEDLGSYLQVIDRFGRAFREDQVTVGDLTTASAELTAARTKVTSSATELADAITATNRAAQVPGGSGSTTTTVLRAKSADEHIKAITDAEEDLRATAGDVGASTTVRSAATELHAAAFGVEQAYVSLFVDAGCVADDPAAVRAVNTYVTGLQQDLTTAGYYTGPTDGIYGSQTVGAVKALQEASNLPPTGVVDPATEAALARALADKGTQESLNIAALQGALTATGDYSGAIDGTWTPALEHAIVSYQGSQQLPTTGILDAATLAALLRSGSDGSTTPTTTTTPGPTTTTAATPTTTTAPSTTRAP